MKKPGITEYLKEAFLEIRERPFDTYVLGPFLIWYGLKSKNMGKWPRRLIVSAGVYQIFYKWSSYREAAAVLEDPQGLAKLTTEIINKYEVIG